ncbi:MAG: enoyl-CoA hydratase/isomerase family protein, partial [Pseudomonadales bacterium]|nr:enoyl-CoA hydratase/isomerase family protein [Pseudomonadales bacterium]
MAENNYECIILETKDHVATVTLNRPEIMNALNWQAYAELESVFRDLQKDSEVRCIILTGAGRAFCSGDDVKEIIACWDANGFGFTNVIAKQQLLAWLDDSRFLQPKEMILKA